MCDTEELKVYLIFAGNFNILKTQYLTQYLTNICKIRFMMKSNLKYTLQCQNGFLKKHVGQQWYPNQYYGSPPTSW